MAISGIHVERAACAASQIPATTARSHSLSSLSGDKLRQIALMGQRARILVIDDRQPIAEALAAFLVARPRNIARIRFYSMSSGFRFPPWAVSGGPRMR